ncbi:hypothetical protein PQR72_42120 [Paraburkholderia madseniana]|uniref:hypothetical protein n=1 Tax=Paraburkholderia madseniana TaxID=2599607 RepID=UPI001F3A5488|nr:hypothetical protein [Paraburkholderia madseniana]
MKHETLKGIAQLQSRQRERLVEDATRTLRDRNLTLSQRELLGRMRLALIDIDVGTVFGQDQENYVSRYVYNAVQQVLNDIRLVLLEYGCPPEATVTDWLRERLEATK